MENKHCSTINSTDLSIIIVNYNTKDITCRCLRSIIENIKGMTYEVIVIDNGSKDGSVEAMEKKFPEIILIKNRDNIGFSKAVNQGARVAKGKYLMFLNSDIVARDNVFKKAVDYLDSNDGVGIMGGKLVYPNGSLQVSAWKFPTIAVEFLQRVLVFRLLMSSRRYRKHLDSSPPKDVDWVTGAFMVVKKHVLQATGLFDEKFFMYYEDTDLCKRAKKNGWRVVFYPLMSAIHYDAMTRKLVSDRIYFQARRSQYYYYKKHNGGVQTLLLRSIVIFISLSKIIIQKIIHGIRKEKPDGIGIAVHAEVIKEMLCPSL